MNEAEAEEMVAEIEAGVGRVCATIERMLAATGSAAPRDAVAAGMALRVVAALGRGGQVMHGLMLQSTARADYLKAAPGGIGPWLASHLDYSSSRARQHALEARTIGALPELAQDLAAGAFGPDTTRALTRTAKAVTHTERDQAEELQTTIAIARTDGISAANLHVRVLEHTLDPDALGDKQTKQRARSFLRFADVGDGFTRIDALLDPVRATTVRAAIDVLTGSWYRSKRLDKVRAMPEDVSSTEQHNAQALTHLAEVFLALPPALRKAAFAPPILYYAPQTTESEASSQPATPESTPAPAHTTDAGRMPTSTAVARATGGNRDRNRGRGWDRSQNRTAAQTRARPHTTSNPHPRPVSTDGRHIPPGCAVRAYGDLVALSAMGPMPNSAHLLLTDARGR